LTLAGLTARHHEKSRSDAAFFMGSWERTFNFDDAHDSNAE
jgi:hypothetical protein